MFNSQRLFLILPIKALSHNLFLTFSESLAKNSHFNLLFDILRFIHKKRWEVVFVFESKFLFEFVSSFVFIFPAGPLHGLGSGTADVAPAGQALSGQLASQPLQLVFAFVFAFLASQPPQLVFVFQILSPFPSVFTCCCSLSACPTAICTVNTVI